MPGQTSKKSPVDCCPRGTKPLLVQIPADQNLQQLVAVDFPDQGAGIVVVGDIGGVLGKDVAHDLVDGVISLFLQCPIDGGKDLVDLRVLVHGNFKLPGIVIHVVHTDTTFLQRSKIHI